MKQIFLKVYPNGKTTTNASVLNFDRENKSGEIVIDYSEVDFLDWEKQLDLIFSDGTTAFVTGTGNTLSVPLLESYLKKGSMTVQPVAKRLVGAEVEKSKWQVVALSVRDSLNVLENDASITPSVAEQWDIRITEVEHDEVLRKAFETIRQNNENARIANENARLVFEAYNPIEDYTVGNKVAYNGSSYVCIADSTGNLPTNTTYWLLFASKGDTGEMGAPGEIIAQEIIDARQGEESLGANIAEVKNKLTENAEDKFNLEMIVHKYRRPMITIVDDDGRTEVYTKLKAIVETHGIPITSAIITSRIDSDTGTMTLAQMNELKTLGFEFISHTHNHVDLSALSESAIVSELSQSRNWLLNNGFDSGKEGVVYPFGWKNAIVTKLARRYYRCGIGIDNVNAYINYPPLKTYELERVDLDKGVAVVSAKIDDTVTNNGWIIIMSHSAYPEFSEANLNAIIDYAKTKNIEFVTIKEGLNKIGNIVDILSKDGTNAIIDVDGETYGSLSGYNYIKSNNISANTPITDYKINTTSVTYIPSTHPGIVGFPDGAGGILETHRHLNDAFNYQEYVVRNQDVRFFRRWDSSAWTPWQRTNSLVKDIATDTILASTLLNAMSTENQKNITIQKVNTATGFPEGKPGVLITQPLFGTGLAYQMYHIASSTKIYKRFWTGTEWSPWSRLDFQSALKPVTLNHGTLSAGTSIDFEVGSGAFVFGDNVVATPKTSLPTGILWNSWIVSNGVAKIRLANITINPISVGSVDWLIKTLSNAN